MSLKLSLALLAHTSSLTPLTVLAYSQNEVQEKRTASLNRKSPEVTLTSGSKLQSEVQGLNLPFNVIFSSNCHSMVVILNGAAILEFSFLQLVQGRLALPASAADHYANGQSRSCFSSPAWAIAAIASGHRRRTLSMDGISSCN